MLEYIDYSISSPPIISGKEASVKTVADMIFYTMGFGLLVAGAVMFWAVENKLDAVYFMVVGVGIMLVCNRVIEDAKPTT